MKRTPIIVPRKFVPTVKIPCGYIYITTNLVNGKKYVGLHQSNSEDSYYIGSGTLLKKAIEKYRRENFISEPIDWTNTREELIQKEVWWIDFLGAVEDDSWYNILVGGEGALVGENNPFYGRHHASKTLEENRQFHLGRKASYETIQKMKNSARRGNKHYLYGKSMPKETRQKLSKSHSGINNYNHRPVVQLTLNGDFVKQYSCMSEVSQETGFNFSGISNCCRGYRKSAYGYKWVYLENYIKEAQ